MGGILSKIEERGGVGRAGLGGHGGRSEGVGVASGAGVE